jgi:hypothetical protein
MNQGMGWRADESAPTAASPRRVVYPDYFVGIMANGHGQSVSLLMDGMMSLPTSLNNPSANDPRQQI